MLTLKNLEKPLSEEEGKAFTDVGQQLKLNPNDWDFIEDELMATIQGNDALNQLYQQAKAKLDACDRPIPSNLLPTEAELKSVLLLESKDEIPPYFEGKLDRQSKDIPPYFEGEPDRQSNEILNLTVNVLNTEKPEETAKKLSFLERLSKLLNQPSKND